MKGIKKGLALAAAILILAQGLGGFLKVSAKGADPAADLPVRDGEDLVYVELPTFPEEDGSVFDFIMDPQGLIEATHAAKYGGESFEEGRTLFFKNEEGAYAYSSKSDQLTVTNKSAVPVEVTVTAKLDDCEGLNMAEDEGFSDGNGELFLALTDDRGAETPLKSSEEITVTARLDAASGQGAETYSFGLTGACNPDGDWESVEVRPVVTVTWKVTPLLPEGKETVSEGPEGTKRPDEAGKERAADETKAAESKAADAGVKQPVTPKETKPVRNQAAPDNRNETKTEPMPNQTVSSNKLEQK